MTGYWAKQAKGEEYLQANIKMKHTPFLIFEICTECNLSEEHKHKCPNSHPDRYKMLDISTPITDDKIISLSKEAYNKLGFSGLIGFHYFNEPLMAKERMLKLIKRIKNELPQSRFVLWSNGELIPEDCSELACFDMIIITNYHGKNFEKVKSVVPRVVVNNCNFDERLDATTGPSNTPCYRMFSEFIIDYFGNVHICSIDWRGEVKIGNVWKEPLSVLVAKFQKIRRQISKRAMDHGSPEVCKNCGIKWKEFTFIIPPWGIWEEIWRIFFILANNPAEFLRKILNKK